MNPDLEKLISLHHAEVEIKRLDAESAEVPRLREALEARVAGDRARLDAAREALEASQGVRRENETAVQDLEAKRSKYKGQLMDVKTNKEYTAMLHEIEAVERDIRSREDVILEEMERAEALAADVEREEEAFRSVEEAARGEAAELDARGARLEDEQRRMRAEREKVAATIPEAPRGLYERVATLRGTGMAEARDGVCQACHVKMRPQPWVELRQNEQLVQCEACSRILYYEPPPTVVEP
ncbi:MAG: C4-type zinc ribbon domain-containing protein [Acidobacteria bacterium]|nr:C4-type zinc ribbon domain-containing protein [Acidobacteriota bacterium]